MTVAESLCTPGAPCSGSFGPGAGVPGGGPGGGGGGPPAGAAGSGFDGATGAGFGAGAGVLAVAGALTAGAGVGGGEGVVGVCAKPGPDAIISPAASRHPTQSPFMRFLHPAAAHTIILGHAGNPWPHWQLCPI